MVFTGVSAHCLCWLLSVCMLTVCAQVMDVIKKSGTTTQLGLIVFLMLVLIGLAVVAVM